MVNSDTLLAHLAHRIAGGTENAAVEALAYILNRSGPASAAFNSMMDTAVGAPVEDCTRFQTQVTAGDRSRPDFVGYDGLGEKRVVGEAKFYAGLGDGQAKAYVGQLSAEGAAVLLFVVPEMRIDRLWTDVMKDMGEGDDGEEVDVLDAPPGMRRAKLVNSGRRLVMVSWRSLLGRMLDHSLAEPAVQADIRQLQGLAERMDSEEVQPVRREQLAPEIPRLLIGLNRLVDEALGRAECDGWIFPLAQRWSRGNAWNSTGWWLRISSAETRAWFGVYLDLWAWAECEDSPLWLHLYDSSQALLDEVSSIVGLQVTDGTNFPVRLKTNALYEDMLEDVVLQLRRIADAIEAAAPDC